MSELEDLSSPAFQEAVQDEGRQWKEALRPLRASVQSWKRLFQIYQSKAYPESPTLAPVEFEWAGHRVRKQAGSAGFTVNVWIDSWHRKALAGIGFGEDHFFTIEDVGEGAEEFELTVWTWNSAPEKVWSHKPVGPTAAFQGPYLYYTGVENRLRYPDVWCKDIMTGTETRIFEEPDKQIQVSVLKRQGVFVHTANALNQRLGLCTPTGVTWIAEKQSTLVPLSPTAYAMNESMIMGNKEVRYKFGYFLEDAIQVGDAVLVVLVKDGSDSLWHWTEGGGWCPLHITKGLSHIQIFHDPTKSPRFLFRCPNHADSVWEYKAGKGMMGHLKEVLAFPEPLALPYVNWGSATSGSIQIPYMCVSAVKNPHGLIVEGYGAYGISSRRAYPIRWLPYLARGWAFAYVCPRGGREGGDAWYNGGRTALRKHHTFEDTALAIREVQEVLGLGADRTIFFGRSAGGWLAARIAQDHPELVSAVYTEVPYVDVLRTTSNPDLPLTQLEYDEFGDPRRPAEYQALRRLSPVDTVRPCKNRCPHVVIRTALHDTQVYPYESLKWAKKLRAAGWPSVYVGIDEGGHFAGADVMLQQRAEDAALLTHKSHRAKTLKKRVRLRGKQTRPRR